MTRLCRIELAHEHFGALPAPLRLTPEIGTERVLREAGLVVRPDGTDLDIMHGPGVSGTGATELAFAVHTTEPGVAAMTAGIAQSSRVGEMRLTPGLDWQRFETANYRAGAEGDARLAILRLTVPPQARDLMYRLRFPTLAVRWVYAFHGLAAGIPVEIKDEFGAVRFVELLTGDGKGPVRSFGSEAPLPVYARGAAPAGFRLTRDGRAVALNLPSASPEHLVSSEGGAPIAVMDISLC